MSRKLTLLLTALFACALVGLIAATIFWGKTLVIVCVICLGVAVALLARFA